MEHRGGRQDQRTDSASHHPEAHGLLSELRRPLLQAQGQQVARAHQRLGEGSWRRHHHPHLGGVGAGAVAPQGRRAGQRSVPRGSPWTQVLSPAYHKDRVQCAELD